MTDHYERAEALERMADRAERDAARVAELVAEIANWRSRADVSDAELEAADALANKWQNDWAEQLERNTQLVIEAKQWQSLYNDVRDAAEKRNTELTERVSQLEKLNTVYVNTLDHVSNCGAICGACIEEIDLALATKVTRQDYAKNITLEAFESELKTAKESINAAPTAQAQEQPPLKRKLDVVSEALEEAALVAEDVAARKLRSSQIATMGGREGVASHRQSDHETAIQIAREIRALDTSNGEKQDV